MSAASAPRRRVVLPRPLPLLTPLGRRLIALGGIALLAFAALALARLAQDPARFPVREVDVRGTLDYTDREALAERVAAHAMDGFYGLDIDALRRDVETLPWVARARVGRVWPDRVSVEIDEHEPVARWNEDALISKGHALVHPPQLEPGGAREADWRALFAELPRLGGVDGRHAAVLDDFRRYASELERVGARLVALEEDGRHSQTLELDGGVTVRLGDSERDLRLARFIDVHDRLVTPLEGRPARFDMRYSNGFALAGAERLAAEGAARP